jgi:protoporphyrinogen oxidase
MTTPQRPEPDPQPDLIVILGAGVAGLATAYRLLQRWRDEERPGPPPRVVLLEKEDRPGGLAVSLSRDGIITDLGPHRLHTELPEIEALLGEVAQERLLTVRRESHIYWRGRRLKYPISPLELALKIGPLETAKLAFPAVAAKLGLGTGATDDADSFENIMRGRFGSALWEKLLGPYVEKVWKRSGGQIHGDAARVRVSAGGITDLAKKLLPRRSGKQAPPAAVKFFRYPKGGLQTLVDLLTEKVRDLGAEIRVNAPVEAIEWAPASEGGQRRVGAIQAGGERFQHPAAVVATIPLPTLGKLLGGDAETAASGLDYLGLLLAVLVVRKERLSRDNWLYFFDPGLLANRGYEAKNFDPDLAPPGKTALCCEVTAPLDSDLWTRDRDALGQQVAREISQATGLFSMDDLETVFVHPVRWAYPVYSLDYRDRLGRALGALADIENLLPCGRQGLFNHNNTDHSMSMGLAVAEAILERPDNPGSLWHGGLDARFGHFRIVD